MASGRAYPCSSIWSGGCGLRAGRAWCCPQGCRCSPSTFLLPLLRGSPECPQLRGFAPMMDPPVSAHQESPRNEPLPLGHAQTPWHLLKLCLSLFWLHLTGTGLLQHPNSPTGASPKLRPRPQTAPCWYLQDKPQLSVQTAASSRATRVREKSFISNLALSAPATRSSCLFRGYGELPASPACASAL